MAIGVANDEAIDLRRRRDRAADEISEREVGELIPAVPDRRSNEICLIDRGVEMMPTAPSPQWPVCA